MLLVSFSCLFFLLPKLGNSFKFLLHFRGSLVATLSKNGMLSLVSFSLNESAKQITEVDGPAVTPQHSIFITTATLELFGQNCVIEPARLVKLQESKDKQISTCEGSSRTKRVSLTRASNPEATAQHAL